jgi:hypothetical protein
MSRISVTFISRDSVHHLTSSQIFHQVPSAHSVAFRHSVSVRIRGYPFIPGLSLPCLFSGFTLPSLFALPTLFLLSYFSDFHPLTPVLQFSSVHHRTLVVFNPDSLVDYSSVCNLTLTPHLSNITCLLFLQNPLVSYPLEIKDNSFPEARAQHIS